jgi:Kef-type K+ transport system membrane component KefB
MPEAYAFVFTPAVIQSLNGIAWWAVMLFAWIAGVELDLHEAWKYRRESALTASLALGMPLALGCAAALVLLPLPGWVGPAARPWQFVLGISMACAVTALPILILLMEKLEILRYASLDDIAIWGVLAVILLDWQRVGRQAAFVAVFLAVAVGFRQVIPTSAVFPLRWRSRHR